MKIVSPDYSAPPDLSPGAKIIEVEFGCQHGKGFTITKGVDAVVCKDCGEKLTPMWVLTKIAQSDSNLRWRIVELNKELARLADKKRCKCLHCGQMTPIERR